MGAVILMNMVSSNLEMQIRPVSCGPIGDGFALAWDRLDRRNASVTPTIRYDLLNHSAWPEHGMTCRGMSLTQHPNLNHAFASVKNSIPKNMATGMLRSVVDIPPNDHSTEPGWIPSTIKDVRSCEAHLRRRTYVGIQARRQEATVERLSPGSGSAIHFTAPNGNQQPGAKRQ